MRSLGAWLSGLTLAVGVALSGAAPAQDAPSWMMPDILAAAKAEGGLTIYGSVNEQEALPLWKFFEDATGIKIDYVRASDSQLTSRIMLEARAQQKSWDMFVSTAVIKLPTELLAQTDPPLASTLIPQARDPNRRWYGSSANYNTPAYNTKFVKAADMPKNFEGFLDHPEWAGKIAIDGTDGQWLSAIFAHYGEDRAKKLMGDLVSKLKITTLDGHLAVARAVGLGEYWIALNNYTTLTYNVQLSGEPTDIWPMDPVALFLIQIGVNSRAPHPKTALLATNFLLSREAQQFAAKTGRIPVRGDVTPNPPEALTRLDGRKIVATQFSPEEERKWQRTFESIFKQK